MKKCWIFLCSLLCFWTTPVSIQADETLSQPVSSKAAMAIDAESGQILYEKNADQLIGIASVSKLMTAYLVYEAIDQGKLKWDDKVHISEYAFELLANQMASNVPLDKEEYTVKQLMEASLVSSANSATIALAEKVAGSEPEFVDRMKEHLQKWGIKDAHLVNATGLSNEFLSNHRYPGSKEDEENLLSARQVAVIAQHLIQDYPDVVQFTATASYTLDGNTFSSTNLMLENNVYYREGIKGLKTGSSGKDGNSLVTYFEAKDRRILTIVLGEDGAEKTYTSTNQILNAIQQTYVRVNPLDKDHLKQEYRVSIKDGKVADVAATPKQTLTYWAKKTDKAASLTFTPSQNVTAPLQKGESIGKATVDISGKKYLSGKQPSVEMVASAPVDRSFFLKVWWNHFVDYVNTNL